MIVLPTDSDSTLEQSRGTKALGEAALRAATDNPLIRAISGLIEAHLSVTIRQATLTVIKAAELNLANELSNWQRR